MDKSDWTKFRELDDQLWADLMLGAVSVPALPPEQLQRDWCGSAGTGLSRQSADFYRLVKDKYARYSRKPLSDSTLLDFGCGWGRLTRLFAKDLRADQIFGCDADQGILEWCRTLSGTFRQSDPKPRRLPFEERFDLALAFSIFTHLGPNTHESALSALQGSLARHGLFIVTIRPRKFLEVRGGGLEGLTAEAIERMLAAYDSGRFVYHPYNLPAVEGEVPYGEAVIPLRFIEAKWTDRFEILDQSSSESDPYQVLLVMCRK